MLREGVEDFVQEGEGGGGVLLDQGSVVGIGEC